MQRRCSKAATLGLIALASYFQASGISQLCAARLSGPKAPAGARTVSFSADSPAADRPTAQNASVFAGTESHTTSARSLLDRNPFDSGGLRPLDGPAQTLTAVSVSDCRGMSATLIASFADSRSWSVAAVTAKAGEKPTLVRVGETIGQKTVRLVEWNRVVLEEGDATCEIETFRSHAVTHANDVRAVAPVAILDNDVTKAIRKVGPNEARIDRSTVDRVLANPFEFLKATRIVPEQQNGNVVGIRLFGIKTESLLGALGFENGDRLESVNGLDMGTPEQMMSAYAALRAQEHLTVKLNRAGRTLNLDVEVR